MSTSGEQCSRYDPRYPLGEVSADESATFQPLLTASLKCLDPPPVSEPVLTGSRSISVLWRCNQEEGDHAEYLKRGI